MVGLALEEILIPQQFALLIVGTMSLMYLKSVMMGLVLDASQTVLALKLATLVSTMYVLPFVGMGESYPLRLVMTAHNPIPLLFLLLDVSLIVKGRTKNGVAQEEL